MRADLPLALLVSLLGAALPACGAGGGGGATSIPGFPRSSGSLKCRSRSRRPSSCIPSVSPDLKPGAMRILARSTPKSARETTTDVDLGFARRWASKEKDFAQYAVAAVVTGKLRSAFPPKTATSRGQSRVLVISSSPFFGNPFARAATPTDVTMTELAMPYAQQVLTSTLLVRKNTLD